MAKSVRSFILLSVARSGSNLLQNYLNQHDSVQCLGEIFKESFPKETGWHIYAELNLSLESLHTSDLVSFWKLVLEKFGPSKAWTGAKIFYYTRPTDPIWDHFAASRTPIVHLIRRQLVDSYLSLKLAKASGIWMQGERHDTRDEYAREVLIDLTEFGMYCMRIQSYVAKSRELFRNNPFIEVSYSELIGERQDTMAEVYSFFGLPDQKTTSQLAKQLSRKREEIIINWQETSEFIEQNQILCVIS